MLVEQNPAQAGARSYFASGLSKVGSASASSTQLAAGAMQAGMGISLSNAAAAARHRGDRAGGRGAVGVEQQRGHGSLPHHPQHRSDGNDVWEVGQQGQQVPVAKGWLRVSHRELDPDLSRPYRPYHRHRRRLSLEPGEIVRVEVEIWPTSMVFAKGHRIAPRHPAA